LPVINLREAPALNLTFSSPNFCPLFLNNGWANDRACSIMTANAGFNYLYPANQSATQPELVQRKAPYLSATLNAKFLRRFAAKMAMNGGQPIWQTRKCNDLNLARGTPIRV